MRFDFLMQLRTAMHLTYIDCNTYKLKRSRNDLNALPFEYIYKTCWDPDKLLPNRVSCGVCIEHITAHVCCLVVRIVWLQHFIYLALFDLE